MLGSGEFVMLLLRCCLLLMLWVLMLLLLPRPRGRAGARPMRASSPSVGRTRSFRLGEMCCLDVQNAPFEHFRKRCAVGVCTLSSRQGRVWGGFGNSSGVNNALLNGS